MIVHPPRFSALPLRALRAGCFALAALAAGCAHRETAGPPPSARPSTPVPRTPAAIARPTSSEYPSLELPASPPLPQRSARPAAHPTRPPQPTMTPQRAPQPVRSVPPSPHAPAILNAMPPNAPPRIVRVDVPSVVHGGQMFVVHVVTTSNVASCELRVFGTVIPLQRPTYGNFVLRYGIPNLPGVFHRTYDVEFTAHNAAGLTATRHVALTLD